MPATKRIQFTAAVHLVKSIFTSAIYRIAIPWAVQTEVVQSVLSNLTESIARSVARDNAGGHLVDEL